MRRMDRAVTDPSEIEDIMSRCEVLHLAIASQPAPYLLPVSFGMEPDGMTLYIHGAMTGYKYDLLQADNRVGFEMDCTHGLVLDEASHDCTVNYESVMGWGTVKELTGRDEKLHALDCIMAHYHSEDFPYNQQAADRTRVLCLEIQERTAKRRRKIIGR
ncbi:MAG: pyridoxamine 5'-phosphate oxidase family protein [Faecousia sp.]